MDLRFKFTKRVAPIPPFASLFIILIQGFISYLMCKAAKNIYLYCWLITKNNYRLINDLFCLLNVRTPSNKLSLCFPKAKTISIKCLKDSAGFYLGVNKPKKVLHLRNWNHSFDFFKLNNWLSKQLAIIKKYLSFNWMYFAF